MNHQDKQEEERRIWKNRIDDLKLSGLSVAQYGKSHALSVHQIYYWKSKFSDNQNDPSPPPKPKSSSPMIKIVPKTETRSSKLPDPKWVAELIKALHEIL
jgi:hypothetical protein